MTELQLGPAYERFSAADRVRHAELLERIRGAADVEVNAQRGQGDHWTVTVCAADCVGLLSIICGLFTAHRIDIVSGDVFTLPGGEMKSKPPAGRMRHGGSRWRRPAPAPRSVKRKILDVFDVQAPSLIDASFWTRFRDDFASLVGLLAGGKLESARERITDRVSEAARAAAGPDTRLFPVSIEVDNASSPTLTELRIRSTNTLGFLFEFANALAMLNVNIESVEIRTVDSEVRDTFWVTDVRGQKIVAAERLHELRVAAALIKQFTHLLPRSPNPAQALRQFSSLAGQIVSRPDWAADLQSLESDAVLRTIAELMGVSQFLWEDFLRMQHENLFPVLRDVPALGLEKTKVQLHEDLSHQLAAAAGDAEQSARLNQFKDREMFRIDLRHITRRIGFEEFAAELSDLAEVIVEEAGRLCHRKLRERLGDPSLSDGRPCPWCICGLGKFGGRELGFASDVELIFIYERDGSTHTQRSTNSHCFEELVSEFLRTLIARREGIFEIDLRLRPYGKGGPLASSLDGFTGYFSPHGAAEQFERMALVKLRPVAGDRNLAERVTQARDAFVYSGKPLDFGNIRHLRHRQATELVTPGQVNAKHSAGGLVDVEYFVQAKQIEAGHSDARVRVTNTLEAIDRLARGGYLRADLVVQLRDTYSFLRRLIDALRVVRGHARELTIPPAESREFAYLARRLQYDSAAQLAGDVQHRMEFARELWNG